jgi:hypothetical protein
MLLEILRVGTAFAVLGGLIVFYYWLIKSLGSF